MGREENIGKQETLPLILSEALPEVASGGSPSHQGGSEVACQVIGRGLRCMGWPQVAYTGGLGVAATK